MCFVDGMIFFTFSSKIEAISFYSIQKDLEIFFFIENMWLHHWRRKKWSILKGTIEHIEDLKDFWSLTKWKKFRDHNTSQ